MTQTLRWGLLSTARINRRLIPAIRAARGHSLRAVASRDLDRARQYAREWKIPAAYGSYEELLADPEIDVIYNPLPNHLHAEWSIHAAQAGKHVLCEKPLALTAEEIDAMIAAAREHQVIIAEAFMYRHHPRTQKIQEWIQSGAIGEVSHIDAAYTIQLGRPDNYRWQPEAGGGCLWDIGCYPVSYARMVFGVNPVEVHGKAEMTPGGVDQSFTGLLTYPGGATLNFYCSYVHEHHSRMEIFGSEGTLIVENPYSAGRGDALYLLKDGRRRKIRTGLPGELAQGEVEDLGRAALTGAEQRLPLSESREINQALVALLESARRGEPVRL
jgi:predicted dehydrogenase